MKGKAIVGQLALMLIAMRAAAGFMKTKLQINQEMEWSYNYKFPLTDHEMGNLLKITGWTILGFVCVILSVLLIIKVASDLTGEISEQRSTGLRLNTGKMVSAMQDYGSNLQSLFVKENQYVPNNKKSSQLLYKSTGISRKRKIVIFLCSIYLIVLGFVAIIVRNIKYKGVSVSSSMTGYIGTIGGGNVFSEKGQQMLFIAGIVLIVLGINFLLDIIALRKNCFFVYKDHIEGCTISILFLVFKKEFYLEWHDIYSVQISNIGLNERLLRLTTSSGNYNVILYKNSEKVCEAIRKVVSNMTKPQK